MTASGRNAHTEEVRITHAQQRGSSCSLAACSSGSEDAAGAAPRRGLRLGGEPATAPPATKGTIGVAMPTKSSERWIADGDNMKEQLEAAGYKVDLQYAEDDIPTQVSQVENMVTKGDQMLVIAAIDGTALGRRR